MSDGSTRTFLKDGDEVVIRGKSKILEPYFHLLFSNFCANNTASLSSRCSDNHEKVSLPTKIMIVMIVMRLFLAICLIYYFVGQERLKETATRLGLENVVESCCLQFLINYMLHVSRFVLILGFFHLVRRFIVCWYMDERNWKKFYLYVWKLPFPVFLVASRNAWFN